jgi:hypothetical protein
MDPPKTLEELLRKKARRMFTLNIDFETYAIIDQVAKLTTKSRPAVIAAFVSTAYDQFIQKARDSGIPIERTSVPHDIIRKRGRPVKRPRSNPASSISPPEVLKRSGLLDDGVIGSKDVGSE